MPYSLVLLIWRLAVGTKLFAVSRMVYGGTVRRFPLLVSYLAISAIRSVVLMTSIWQKAGWSKASVYSFSAPMLLALECCAVIEVFHVATAPHRFKSLGAIFLGIMGSLAVGASILTRFALAPASPAGILVSVMTERYSLLPMVIVLLGTRWILHVTSVIPVEPLASRGLTVMTLHCSFGLAITALAAVTELQQPVITQFLPVASDLLTSALWATWFIAGAKVPAEREAPAPTHLEVMEATRLTEERLGDLRELLGVIRQTRG